MSIAIIKRIYKYPFLIGDIFEIEMPEDAVILWLASQNNIQYIWALVEIDKPKIKRTFRIYGTGYDFELDDNSYSYIGSFNDHIFIWHVFEINM